MQQVEQTNQRPAVAETFRLKAFRVVTGELFAAATAQHALDMAKSELSRPQLSLKDVVAVSHSDLVVAEVNGAEHATGASVLLARATAPGLLGRCRTDHTYQTVFVEALSGPSLEWAVREASFKAFGFMMSAEPGCPEDTLRNAVRRWLGDVVSVPADLHILDTQAA
ncbi:hypothetical protein LU689_26070 [Pseudomonas asiatica]|uniref:Uncharacterized protein n=3 Tax=Pseudomonas TaxID=286 RepID=A0AAP7FHW6_9PSED|nr:MULTISPECIES: hypothetical protein [Pseudomonas]AXQ51141.1 hypothetical protein DZC31_31175 [Stenotrophomonas rhizophila]ESW38596.1 hypothetical protein O164_17085 [Pseudomonas taiwanensis SJ9]KIC79817.1 hypothetical protein RR51_24855 [Pseudomonas sp. C5pp]MCE0755554.1 hypothetical protein [Pseudomonas asiatica]MCE0853372.1 hypothetical protein [Pseudomonas asiatica]